MKAYYSIDDIKEYFGDVANEFEVSALEKNNVIFSDNNNDTLPCPFCGCDISFYVPWYEKACVENESDRDVIISHPNNGCVLAHAFTTHAKKEHWIKEWNKRTSKKVVYGS